MTKATEPSADSLDNNRMSFWFKHVLPLLFDDVPAVQNGAIRAMDAVLPHLEKVAYETHADWPATKAFLTE